MQQESTENHERRKADGHIEQIYKRLEDQDILIAEHSDIMNKTKSYVKGNVKKIETLSDNVKILNDNVEPIISGIHSIQESVKVLGWVGKGVKWVGSIGVGLSGTVYVWTEHVQHYFKH